MQKKSLLFYALTIFSMNFVSAYGYYGGSLGDALDRLDSTTVVLALLFMMVFALLNWVFSRYFKDNKATAGVIAFAASLLIVFGIYKNGFDIESVFGDFGVTSDLFYTLLPLTVIAGIVFLIVKFKRKSLLIMGLLLFVLSILTYEKATLWLIGGILIIIWFFVREKGSSQNRTRTTHAG